MATLSHVEESERFRSDTASNLGDGNASGLESFSQFACVEVDVAPLGRTNNAGVSLDPADRL